MVLAFGHVLHMAGATHHHSVVLGSEVQVVQLVEVSVVRNQLHMVLKTQGGLNQESTGSYTGGRNRHDSLQFTDHFRSLDFFISNKTERQPESEKQQEGEREKQKERERERAREREKEHVIRKYLNI